MKKLVTCLTAGLLVVGAQSLMAQTTTTNTPPNTPPGEHQGDHHRREDLLKMLGLTPEDLKGLSKEDRMAKMKEAAQTVISDLEAKKTAGTLDEHGQKRLEHVQKWLEHANGAATKPPQNN